MYAIANGFARDKRWIVADEPDRYEDDTLLPPTLSAYEAVSAYDELTDFDATDDEIA